MAELCRCKHEIPAGDRKVEVELGIEWGTDDERADWKGVKTFCSFACLRDWAAEQVEKWDPVAEVSG